MSWYPTTVVTVDGLDVTGDAIDGVQITRGRDGVDQQPRAGYVRATLLDATATRPRTRLDAAVTVTVDGLALVTDARVSDSAVRLAHHSAAGGKIAEHSMLAVGKLARLHRMPPDASYLIEHDGDRVATILAGLALTWANAPTNAATSSSWADVPDGVTWQTVEPTPLDVDQPGHYQLAALDPAPDRWTALQQAANDGGGVLAELRGGGIRYTDAHGRTARAAADGFLELPRAAVIAPGLETAAAVADLANHVLVKWDGGTAEAVDDQLVALDGTRELSVQTQLVDGDDAQARADRLLLLRKQEAASIEQVDLALDKVDDTERAALLALEVGTPVRLGGLPPALGTSFLGVVESLTWTITRTTARLSLRLSDWSLSEYALRWNALDPADTWDDLDPLVTWTNAQELVA